MIADIHLRFKNVKVDSIQYISEYHRLDYGGYLQAILFYMEWKGGRLRIFNPKSSAHYLT